MMRIYLYQNRKYQPSKFFFTVSYTQKLIPFTKTARTAQIEYPFHKFPITIASLILICCAICLDFITSIGYVNVQLANPANPPEI